jgi:hypothetical protein
VTRIQGDGFYFHCLSGWRFAPPIRLEKFRAGLERLLGWAGQVATPSGATLHLARGCSHWSLVHWNPATTIAAANASAVVVPDHQRLLSAGQQVPVMTDYVVERFGMTLECRYIAWVQGSRIAQGVVNHSDL